MEKLLNKMQQKPEFETTKVIDYMSLIDFFRAQENFDLEDTLWSLLTDTDGKSYVPVTITNGCYLPWRITDSLDYFRESDEDLINQFNSLLVKHYNLTQDEDILFYIVW
jgi:hypothetical protein